MNVHFILCDLKQDLCQEWVRYINQLGLDKSKFTIFNGKLSDYQGKFDCIVSPGNAFGKMDGSFDDVISKMFSPHDIDKTISHVQHVLGYLFNGYQPIGTSIIIPMESFKESRYNCKFLAHTPTMRQPGNMYWNKEIVYNCMYSLMNSVWFHNKSKTKDKISTVFVTGLATGIGRYPVSVCAGQMTLAYKHFQETLLKPKPTTEWDEITRKGIDLDEINRSNAFV